MPVSGLKLTTQLKQMTTVGLTNRRNWRPFFSRKAMTQSPLQKHSRTTCVTAVLQWMFRSSSEGPGEEGEVIGWLCTLRSVSAV